MTLPLSPPVSPMLATLAREVPDGDGWSFEPKWDGFRCIVFCDGGEVTLTSRKERPFNRYFPELLPALAAALPDRIVIDGEIVVPSDPNGEAGLDFDALLQRIHPAESRVQMLAASTPAAFVAFDVLAEGDRSLLDEPFDARRERLETSLASVDRIHLTPVTRDRDRAVEWFHRFEGAGLDGVIAKRRDGPYTPGKRTWVKVKHEREGHAVAVGYRIHKDGRGVGSVVLALVGGDGAFHQVGVASGFSARQRADLLAELAPLAHPDGPQSPPPEATSRWNVGKDLSFVPFAEPRVAAITFGQLQGGRFRHGVRLRGWRDDLDPHRCRMDQLDVADPVPFAALVTPGA